jgi:hypothetical protein
MRRQHDGPQIGDRRNSSISCWHDVRPPLPLQLPERSQHLLIDRVGICRGLRDGESRLGHRALEEGLVRDRRIGCRLASAKDPAVGIGSAEQTVIGETRSQLREKRAQAPGCRVLTVFNWARARSSWRAPSRSSPISSPNCLVVCTTCWRYRPPALSAGRIRSRPGSRAPERRHKITRIRILPSNRSAPRTGA